MLGMVPFLNRIRKLEAGVHSMGYDLTALVQSEFKRRVKLPVQRPMQYGIYRALCVQTIDPRKQNRVQFYHPLWSSPDATIDRLPFAYPISTFGGFDDSGVNWIPPAGSSLMLSCEAGDRDAVYYHGTTWTRDRGPDGEDCNGQPHNFNFNVKEYNEIWEGHRKGYLVGPNDGSQVLPPWNTENYNNFDASTTSDFYKNEEEQKRVTWPHIYGFKTPEKHMLKMVDGNPKCGRRYKRLELMSGTGNWLMMKDDHLHPCGEWANTKLGPPEPQRKAVRCGEIQIIDTSAQGQGLQATNGQAPCLGAPEETCAPQG